MASGENARMLIMRNGGVRAAINTRTIYDHRALLPVGGGHRTHRMMGFLPVGRRAMPSYRVSRILVPVAVGAQFQLSENEN